MGILSCHAYCTSEARIDGKTVVITGANSGIGKETALDLYKRGGHIILACRSLENAKEAIEDIEMKTKDIQDCGKLSSVQLNLSSLTSVRNCAKQLLEENPHIHILINNAGIMACPYTLTEDGYESQFAVNHLGHFLLTCLLIPRLKMSAPARIVNISSDLNEYGRMNFDDIMSKNSYSALNAYSQSKLAVVLFTKELAQRLQDTGVTVYVIHPGVIATNLLRHLSDTYSPGVAWIMSKSVKLFCKTPYQGAQTTIYCAIDEKCEKESGLYYSECKVKRESPAGRNVEDAKKLWEMSKQFVKLDEGVFLSPEI